MTIPFPKEDRCPSCNTIIKEADRYAGECYECGEELYCPDCGEFLDECVCEPDDE